MKTLVNITASVSEDARFGPPKNVHSALLVEPNRGQFVQIMLTHDGLVFGFAGQFVGIPQRELLALAQPHLVSVPAPDPKPTPSDK